MLGSVSQRPKNRTLGIAEAGVFYMPDTLPIIQSTVWKDWRNKTTNQNVHSVEMQIHANSKGKVAAWINIGNGEGSSSWFWQQYENTPATDRAPHPSPFEPKIKKLRQTFGDYYCAKFQVIPIGGFCFIILTYTPTAHTLTPTYTSWQIDQMNYSQLTGIIAVVLKALLGVELKHARTHTCTNAHIHTGCWNQADCSCWHAKQWKRKTKLIVQTFYTSFSQFHTSQSIGVSCPLFQFESAKYRLSYIIAECNSAVRYYYK